MQGGAKKIHSYSSSLET